MLADFIEEANFCKILLIQHGNCFILIRVIR